MLWLIIKYDQVQSLSDDQCIRLTGVKLSTFDKLIKILEEADKKKKLKEVEKIS